MVQAEEIVARPHQKESARDPSWLFQVQEKGCTRLPTSKKNTFRGVLPNMKSLVLSTSSNETDKYSDGLKRFGEVLRLTYDQLGHSESLMMSKAKEYAPDFIVYIGSRWGQQPSIAAL